MQTATRLNPFFHRQRVAALLWLLSLSLTDAHAVFTWGPTGTPRQLTLQVGSSEPGTINTVVFDVEDAPLRPNADQIEGVPSASSGTAPATPTNGVLIRFATRIRSADTTLTIPLRLTVNSSVGLSCVSGTGCGTTIIPFNNIGWTAYQHDSTYSTYDIQDGTFNNSSNQSLINLTFRGGSLQGSQTLVFHYKNTNVYPAGQYRGQVTYTLSMP